MSSRRVDVVCYTSIQSAREVNTIYSLVSHYYLFDYLLTTLIHKQPYMINFLSLDVVIMWSMPAISGIEWYFQYALNAYIGKLVIENRHPKSESKIHTSLHQSQPHFSITNAACHTCTHIHTQTHAQNLHTRGAHITLLYIARFASILWVARAVKTVRRKK